MDIMQFMNVLIITAHPASYGFAHKIAERYKKTVEDMGHEAEIIDLYDPRYRQDFLSFENIKIDCGPTETKSFFQEKITAADELVFAMPVWWGSAPAIFKNFLDVNFEAGFAFNYLKNGKVAKHLKGKKARIFLTADGPRVVYIILDLFYTFWFNVVVFGLCGIRVTTIDIFSRMFKKRNDRDREKMLSLVEKRARSLGRARV